MLHDTKDFVLSPDWTSLFYKFLVLAPLMDLPAWKGFRFVLIMARILRNFAWRDLTGFVGLRWPHGAGPEQSMKMKSQKIINKTFSNNSEAEGGGIRQWRAEVALEVFISEKDLFSSISLDSEREICIFLRRWCNPTEWGGIRSTGHSQRVLIRSGQINFMLIIGN